MSLSHLLAATVCLVMASSPAHAAEVQAGQDAPSFAGFDLHGNLVSLKKLRTPAQPGGKPPVVVINFYASWCVPCQAGTPKVMKVVAALADKGVTGLVVATSDTAEKAAPALEKIGFQGLVVADPYLKVSKRFGVEKNLPRTLVVGRSGRVKQVFTREDAPDFEAQLEAAVVAALAE